jgi:signal transduction histidine kinase
VSENTPSIDQDPISKRVRELELMVEVTRQLTSTFEQERLLTLISSIAVDLVNCEDASIILEDEHTGKLYFLTAAGTKTEALKKIRFPVEGSIAGTVFRTLEPLIVQDTANDSRFNEEVDKAIDFRTQSILAVPMMFQDRPIGVLEAINKNDGGEFDAHDQQILLTLAAQAAVAIENARLVKDLKDANVRLAELDRLKSDFIAIASHELRTPLTLILGYATFLREDASGRASEQLDLVLGAATQLKNLIEDMVNLTNLDAGGAELALQEFSLQEQIQECIASQQQFAAAKSLNIKHAWPDTTVRVQADREKIAIVVTNLLNNAIKYTPPGGRIQVGVRRDGGMVAVSVSDTGMGIPETELDRIFDRFYQIESHLTRVQGGMGLGLSIAKGMIDLHGGRIWAESVEGRGSRFTFSLPIKGQDAASA